MIDVENQSQASFPLYTPVRKKNRSALIVLVLIVIIAISAILAFSGLSNFGTNSNWLSVSKPIHHIDYFLVSEKGDVAQVQFALMSENLDFQSTDGTAILRINDASTNKVLYENSFTIKKSDFNNYQTLLGKTVLAVQWSIPLSSVQKCVSYATATLTFTSADGHSFNNEVNYVSLPKYTESDLKQSYEDLYLASAKTIGQTVTQSNFKITLVRLGSFTHLQYETIGDEVTEFRLDFTVTCLSQEAQYLFESSFCGS